MELNYAHSMFYFLFLLLGSVRGYFLPPSDGAQWSTSSFLCCTPIATTDQDSVSFVEPILDNSYSNNPLKRIKHVLSSLNLNDAQREIHDRSLNKTGGVWKTKFLGKPAYGVSAYLPEMTTNLTKLEAKGYLQTSWPQSVIDILGPSSLVAADMESEGFQKARKIFSSSLSTKSILSQSLPGIEQAVDKMLQHWKICAEKCEITTFSKDVSAVTYSVIVTSIFGPNSLTDDEMKSLRQWTDSIAKGLLSLPIQKPIIRSLPFFRRYTRAMEARAEMKALLIAKISQRKGAIQTAAETGKEFHSTGMLDAFLLEGGLGEDKVVDFCVDNVILSIFAGYDTTASVSTNLILLLHNYATKDDLAQIRAELDQFDIHNTSATSIPGGILDCVPSLKSAVYESFRFRPVIGSTFRKTKMPIALGKVQIPANTTVQWSHMHGSQSTALYGTGTRPCPLRFCRQWNLLLFCLVTASMRALVNIWQRLRSHW